MNGWALVLTAVLGTGGVAGIAALFRLRQDKESSIVSTVERGVIVLEKINDRLHRENDQLEKDKKMLERENGQLRQQLRRRQ